MMVEEKERGWVLDDIMKPTFQSNYLGSSCYLKMTKLLICLKYCNWVSVTDKCSS